MNKTKPIILFIIAAMNIVFFDLDCIGAAHAAKKQPAIYEPDNATAKQLEHSLDVFSKKVVSKNKVVNLQYKRYGRRAVLSFDIVKTNEMMLMLYLLEYSNGGWKISKEYHYTKTTIPVSANLC